MIQIPKHPNYYIDEFGRIMRNDYYLVPDTSNGYKRVDIDGRKEMVARLVLETFRPTSNQSLKVFYIDGNPMNCRLDNLVWLTASEVQLYSSYTVQYRKELARARD